MAYLTTIAAEGPSWWTRLWFREAGSTFAAESDAIYYFIFWVSAAFFVLLVGLMAYWGLRYKRSTVGEVAEVSSSHNAPLELAWSIVPAILMAVMFFWGFKHYMNKLVAPVDAKQVYVTAYQWGWDFTYPDGGSTIETEDIAAASALVLGELRVERRTDALGDGALNRHWGLRVRAAPKRPSPGVVVIAMPIAALASSVVP